MVFVLLFVAACSSDNSEETFRGSSFGDTIDDVVATEKKQGNAAYEEQSFDNYTTLTYRDVVVVCQH